ncbi:MAG: EpsI family protein [Pirellulales bacterium]|nr:EpsI family protein [Pirellulales bacterium]
MKSPVSRLVVGAVGIVIIFAGALYSSNKGGVHRHIRVPEESLTTIPMEFGKWKGKNEEIDERLFGKINAYEVISRSYNNPISEDAITLHCASFNNFWRRVPHSPKVCYPASGWTTISAEDFELDGPPDPDGNPVKAELVTFEKNDVKVMVLYWFQFGDYVVTNASELASARWKYLNEDTWPPTVKTMLQISANQPERARKQLKEFASSLYQVTRTFK